VQFDFPPTKLQFCALGKGTREPVLAAKMAISCAGANDQPCRTRRNGAPRNEFDSRGIDPELYRKGLGGISSKQFAPDMCCEFDSLSSSFFVPLLAPRHSLRS
jgi:hypothetical protein